MNINNNFKNDYFTDNINKITIITIILFIFIVLIFTNILTQKEIENVQNKQYNTFSKNIKHQLELSIQNKKQTNAFIALALSKNQNIIESLDKNDPELIDLKKFAKNINEFSSYKNIWFQLIDKDGKSFYRSWTNCCGDDMKKARVDVKKMLENPQTITTISVGKYDMTFKSMVPVYNAKNEFIGIFEIISHFYSIISQLERDGVDAVFIADKRYKAQIKRPTSEIFIDDYYVSNLEIKDDIYKLLEKNGIEHYIFDTPYLLHKKEDKIAVSYKITDESNNQIGYGILFKSLYTLKSSRVDYLKQDLVSIMIVLVLISVIVGYYLITQRYERSLIEQHKQHEKEIVKNTKFFTIGQMAAGITHEINTPLTYIKGRSEMMTYDIQDLPDSDIKKELLENNGKILSGINRIGIIVESMREMAQVSPKVKGKYNLYATLVTVLRMVHNRSKQISKIYLNGELFDLESSNKDKYEFMATINNQRIEQVWTIIINNALDELVKFQEYENRYLNIDIVKDEKNIKVTFQDNAGGINENIQDILFEPFVSTKEHSGIGIGLNVAKKIIDEHNGTIKGYNNKQGACFEVTFTS